MLVTVFVFGLLVAQALAYEPQECKVEVEVKDGETIVGVVKVNPEECECLEVEVELKGEGEPPAELLEVWIGELGTDTEYTEWDVAIVKDVQEDEDGEEVEWEGEVKFDDYCGIDLSGLLLDPPEPVTVVVELKDGDDVIYSVEVTLECCNDDEDEEEVETDEAPPRSSTTATVWGAIKSR
jgi:hypothetical protein